MINLKINNEKFKKLISTVLITTSLTNLVGCSLSSEKVETEVDNEGLQNVVVDNKIISVADLKLKDTKTNKIIEKVDKILVGNKFEEITDLTEVIFNSDIEYVLIGDELVSVDRLQLVNSKTNQEINAIDYALVGDELIPIEEYIGSEIKEDKKEECVEEYEELTIEKFNTLAAGIYDKYSQIGLDVSSQEVVDYIMVVNIDKLAKDNNELISTIIGERNIDEVVLNMYNVYSAIMTENNSRYCARNLGWDSIITVSDTIFDAKEKEVVTNIESRVKEIVEAKGNKEEFNKLLNTLLMEMLDATNEEFNMESGSGYSVMTILINFIRINFQSSLDATNSELIKYFVTYAGDGIDPKTGVTYEENSRTTAYYRGIYNLLTDCPGYARIK